MDIVLPYGYNLNRVSICCVLWKPSPKVLLPYVVEKYLWHCIVNRVQRYINFVRYANFVEKLTIEG